MTDKDDIPLQDSDALSTAEYAVEPKDPTSPRLVATKDRPIVAARMQIATSRSVTVYGDSPFPPAEELQKLVAVDPRLKDALLDSFVNEQRHRHELEAREQRHQHEREAEEQRHQQALDIAETRVVAHGQRFGFALAFLITVGGFGSVLMGAEVAGVAGLVAGLGGIVGVAMWNQKSRKQTASDTIETAIADDKHNE